MAHGYERSLFQRLQQSNFKVNMLAMQYRMHPDIARFPSQAFYDDELANVMEKEEFEREFPAPWYRLPPFAPVVFFDLRSAQRVSMQSLVNDEEADFVIQLFTTIQALYPDEDWRTKVAVISPYAEQVSLIKAKVRELYGVASKNPCPIDVNTVDGFQGREKDVIIVSVVRAAGSGNSIGFVRDKRRMNVSMTRPRLNLWVVGHAQVL